MSNPAATQVLYRERVTPKLTSFLPVALVFPTFWLTFAPINDSVGFWAGITVTGVIIWVMLANSPVIEVSPKQIRVGKARIETKFLGKAAQAPYAPRFALRVPNLDPKAYLALQNSQKGLITLEIRDTNDPTPYWVFSTKRPEAALKAIELAKKAN